MNNKINRIHERALRLTYSETETISFLAQKIWSLVPEIIKSSKTLENKKKSV